jgi:hypothetical protein
MNRATMIGLCFIAIEVSALAQDPGGWQRAKWGMTEAQILEMYLGARPPRMILQPLGVT